MRTRYLLSCEEDPGALGDLLAAWRMASKKRILSTVDAKPERLINRRIASFSASGMPASRAQMAEFSSAAASNSARPEACRKEAAASLYRPPGGLRLSAHEAVTKAPARLRGLQRLLRTARGNL